MYNRLMPLFITEALKKVTRHLEPDAAKRDYYEYLEKNLAQMHEGVNGQDTLLQKLEGPRFEPALWDIEDAITFAGYLSTFGLPCRLFDDHIWRVAITQNETDINDIQSVQLLLTQIEEQAEQKANGGNLAPQDLFEAAAVSYHLQSLQWLARGIAPSLHSPHR